MLCRSVTSDVSALSGFGANGHQTISTFPPLSLKFRTAGFPQYGFKLEFSRDSLSKMLSLSVRPAYTQSPQIYTRLKSLSPKRALFRRGTFVQAGLPLSYRKHPVQRSLAPQRVMLSHRIIAYYDLIRASLLLPPVYVLSSGRLPVSLLRAGEEKVPNLSCLSFPIVPSSVPRRLSDCNRLLLHRSLWPSPSLHKVGVRVSTRAGLMRGLRNEAAKFALCYGLMELLALLRQGHLHSSFHLQGHPLEMSSITTRAHNQFPRPDLHRIDRQPYRLHAKSAKNSKKFLGSQNRRGSLIPS